MILALYVIFLRIGHLSIFVIGGIVMIFTHAFQTLIMAYPENLDKIKAWTNHKHFAVRRSAAVILVVPARKGFVSIETILEINDLLMNDSHY